jgi:cob(I)alamin adenosyltransferase
MKLYTRTGDDGGTALFGGERVGKDHERVSAYGAVDEANATIGLAHTASDLPPMLRDPLVHVMSDLFDLGAELATPPNKDGALAERLDSRIDAARVAELEAAIDDATARVPPLTTFVLPTGGDAAARLHLARTVVRRAERELVTLARHTPVRPLAITYINRLSDVLFAWARLSAHSNGHGDVPWQAKKKHA